MIRDHEYDNYPIPEYDPSLPEDERKQLIQKAQADLEAAIENLYRETH